MNMEKIRINKAKKNLFDQISDVPERNSGPASTCNSSPAPSLPSDVENMFDSDDSVWDPDYHAGSLKLNFDYNSDSSSSSWNKNEENTRNPMETALTVHTEERTEKNVTDKNMGSQDAHSNDGKTVKKTRKRLRNPENWTRNLKKNKREHGLEYKDEKGRIHVPRQCQSKCLKQCTYQCLKNFNTAEREIIFKNFWKLSDNKKSAFYSKFVKKCSPERRHVKKENVADCQKQNSFKYFLELSNKQIRVCREFFLTTLNISKQRIYYFFKQNYRDNSGVAQTPLKGKYVKKSLPAEAIDGVRRHIELFPQIESHYCRADRVRLYLDPCLSIEKMYRLYLESNFGKVNPVKSHKYREVFTKEYNFGFLLPKKDRCDTCEKYKIAENKNEEEKRKFDLHIKNQTEGKLERDFDRKTFKAGHSTAVLCFDMQNVFALPKAEVSNFFYKKKFSAYNLTVHCSADKITYCALWHEAISGRSGNHIASALVTLLNRISEANPNVDKLILWSDSCVPQNRNSHMALAIKYFLHSNNRINTIEQKFSEPGHSLVQEIDCVHSKIEKYLKFRELYSPVSLLRQLTNIPPGKAPLKITQMKKENFLNFQAVCQSLNFKDLPFTKVKQINYKKDDSLHISFKCGFNENSPLTCVRLNKHQTRGSAKKQGKNDHININFSLVKVITEKPKVDTSKIKHIESMFSYMPEIDKTFYQTIFSAMGK